MTRTKEMMRLASFTNRMSLRLDLNFLMALKTDLKFKACKVASTLKVLKLFLSSKTSVSWLTIWKSLLQESTLGTWDSTIIHPHFQISRCLRTQIGQSDPETVSSTTTAPSTVSLGEITLTNTGWICSTQPSLPTDLPIEGSVKFRIWAIWAKWTIKTTFQTLMRRRK